VFADRELRRDVPARPFAGDLAEPVDFDIDLVGIEAEESRPTGEPVVLTTVAVDDLPEVEVVTIPEVPARRAYLACKRAVDLLVAPVLIVIALPVLALLMLIVKLDSKGPAIFRQTRVGRNGKPFTFYKFRTMYADARERFPELYAYVYSRSETETMFFKLASDPRCTRVGRRLRRTSLDELPNLLNVIKGDMTLVGPRPEIPEMLRHYLPEQLVKFAVTPGLTGLAQISGRNLLTFQETTTRDIEYVQRRSLRFDLSILVRTPLVVVQMIGAL
jgi:lipopolysaccharide/colanic/teichoic acid biosynthesis glycosyltransferase